MELEVRSTQFAVGHGSFHHSVILDHYRELVLSYVFDCGGSLDSVVRAVVDSPLGCCRGASDPWREHYRGAPNCEYTRLGDSGTVRTPRPRTIDIVVISHLDADHVNGLTSLHRRANIRRLVVPYIDSETVIAATVSDNIAATRANLDSLRSLSVVMASDVDIVEVQRPSEEPPEDSIQSPFAAELGEDSSWHQGATIASGEPLARISGFGDAAWEVVPFLTTRVRESWDQFDSMLQAISPDTAKELKQASVANTALARVNAILDVLAKPEHLSAVRAASHRTRRGDAAGETVKLNPTSIVMYSGPTVAALGHGVDGSLGWMHTGDLPLAQERLFAELSRSLGPTRAKAVGIFSMAHHGAHDGVHHDLASTFPGVYAALGCRCQQYHHPRPRDTKAHRSIGWEHFLVFGDSDFSRHDCL